MTSRAALRDDSGNALIVVMISALVLTMLVFTALARSDSQNVQSAQLARSSTAFAASEAGIDDYIAKLTEDRNYHLHWVHQAEATRTHANGIDKVPSAAQLADDPDGPWEWPGDLTWTYTDDKDRWRSIGNGVEYDVKINLGIGNQVKITSTGRRAGTTDEWRANEAVVRPSSIADFQRIVGDGDVSWGAGAVTEGKLYAEGNIFHDGIPRGNLYAEGPTIQRCTSNTSYCRQAPNYDPGAQGFDSNSSPNIRSQIANPIDFNAFLTSFTEVENAAQAAGLYLNDNTTAGWRIKFTSDGKVAYSKCTLSSGSLATTQPTCGVDTIEPVPANGAIYSPQNVMVSWPTTPSTLDGRVTIVSNLNIYPAGNILNEDNQDDVLGLIARQEIIIPSYVPSVMTWWSANLAQSGDWHTAGSTGSKSTMNHFGSTATLEGGSLTMFNTRNYAYNLNLLNLPPPYYPVLEDAYTVTLFREVDVNS